MWKITKRHDADELDTNLDYFRRDDDDLSRQCVELHDTDYQSHSWRRSQTSNQRESSVKKHEKIEDRSLKK